MAPLALGLVETLGLIPAVEAADTAVKSADVSLAGLERIGSGLVSVKLLGDISSVKAGVAAARAAAERLGEVRSATVIGRMGEGIAGIVSPPEPGSADASDAPAEITPAEAVPPLPDISTLSPMRVVSLRRLARTLSQDFDGFPMTPEKIKFARKKELVETIRDFVTAQKRTAGSQPV